jgi:uncharacterized protein YndB with AHSA1/START domain
VIVKSVVLPCPPARAFVLFTAHASEWWPPERRHTGDPESAIVISESGRFFERDAGGREVELGVVREWEAPRRLVLDWYPGTDAEHPTRVEVTFEAVGEDTRVQVRHGPGAAGDEMFRGRAARYEASWDLVMSALHAAAGPVRR